MESINFQTAIQETASCKTITHMYVRDEYNVTQTIEIMKHGIFKKFDVCKRVSDVVTYLDSTSKDRELLIKEFIIYKINNEIND